MRRRVGTICMKVRFRRFWQLYVILVILRSRRDNAIFYKLRFRCCFSTKYCFYFASITNRLFCFFVLIDLEYCNAYLYYMLSCTVCVILSAYQSILFVFQSFMGLYIIKFSIMWQSFICMFDAYSIYLFKSNCIPSQDMCEINK